MNLWDPTGAYSTGGGGGIHIEELALVKAFGDDYRVYSKRTKRLLPGVF